jgi:hypothetical protein
MAQISLEIDQTILEKIEKVAERRKISISNWVRDNIKRTLENDYPEDFFELFGSINDETFVEPDEIDPKYDLPREQV